MQKFKRIKLKVLGIIGFILCTIPNISRAEVVQEVSGGGEIQNSKLGQGLFNMVRDITGTLQWILPVVGVAMCLFFLFKIVTGDEQDQQRYKKSIVKVLICIVVGLVAVTIVNLISRYFGQG